MAYMNQEHKGRIKAALDPVMKSHGLKYSLAVRNHSTIVCTIKSGSIDFINNYLKNRTAVSYLADFNKTELPRYIDVNTYHYRNHFDGLVRDVLEKIMGALNLDNYDNSDLMTDYFDKGYYVDLNIGTYDKPYQLVK